MIFQYQNFKARFDFINFLSKVQKIPTKIKKLKQQLTGQFWKGGDKKLVTIQILDFKTLDFRRQTTVFFLRKQKKSVFYQNSDKKTQKRLEVGFEKLSFSENF